MAEPYTPLNAAAGDWIETTDSPRSAEVFARCDKDVVFASYRQLWQEVESAQLRAVYEADRRKNRGE